MASDQRDAFVARIYSAARSHDDGAIDTLKQQARPLDPAIALARLRLDLPQSRTDFVAAYPQDADGVNGDYGDRLRRAHLMAPGVPIERLTTLALHGDSDAGRHLLIAQAHAAGDLAGLYDRDAARFLTGVPPAYALAVISRLPIQDELVSTAEADWCASKPRRLLAFTPSPAPVPSAAPSGKPDVKPSAAASADPQKLVLAAQNLVREGLSACTLAIASQKAALRDASRHRQHKRASSRKKKSASRLHST